MSMPPWPWFSATKAPDGWPKNDIAERPALLRALTLGLAFVHTFPAWRHLVLFFARPSWDEAWKGFGALLAIAIYLFPPRHQARALATLWRRRRTLLTSAGWLLTVVHLVPALDHVPRFLGRPSWGDAWRGFGSAVAALWFAAPLPWQMRLVGSLRSACALPRYVAKAPCDGG